MTDGPRAGTDDRTARIAAFLREERQAWYDGALRVLADGDNPDRVALAAHGIREVLEKLPRTPNEKSLKQITGDLEKQWATMIAKTTALVAGSWTGPIDEPLADFLDEVQGFFETFNEDWPGAREEAKRFLERSLPEPDTIEANALDERARRWVSARDYMVGIAHHRASDLTEFDARLREIEDMLIDVALGTLEKYRDIDRMIEEVESRAAGS
jgi:hypothetical protein